MATRRRLRGAWWIRARQLLTFDTPHPGAEGFASEEARVGLVRDAAVQCRGDRIVWVGAWRDASPRRGEPVQEAAVVTPGFVECHTHALFAGWRHADFHARNAGDSYAEILERGGGIHSTVAATRVAGSGELAGLLRARLRRLRAGGCSVVEVKTGYGLSSEEELRHLEIIRKVSESAPVRLVATCLAGHAIPREWERDRAAYVSMVAERLIPEVARRGLAAQVDVFCDRGALTVGESRAILMAARAWGLDRRVHAEELAHTGAARLACEVGARSADHLEHVSSGDISVMAASDVAAVLLPTVTVFLDMEHRAPARALADAGVRIAVSTDFNPGSANGLDMQLAVCLACSLLKLTPGEALRGATRVPAEVLGLAEHHGVLRAGAASDMLAWDVPEWEAIPWHLGSPVPRRWVRPEGEA